MNSRTGWYWMVVTWALMLASTPALAVPPVNDDFDSAIEIPSSFYFSHSENTSEATVAPDDPFCYGQSATVWFRYTAPASGILTFSTAQSLYDTTLCVFTGSRGSLVPVISNNNSNAIYGQVFSQLILNATQGVTYHIMVGAYGASPGGSLYIQAYNYGTQGPDEWYFAPYFSYLPETFSANTLYNTTSFSDPFCFGRGPTVWYIFYPSEDMPVDLDTVGSNYDTTLSVYQGDPFGLQIACNDNDGALATSRVSFFAQAFTPYYIMVGSSGDTPGGYLVLNATQGTPPPPPLNDDIASATGVTSLPFSDSVNTFSATTAPADPPCGSSGSDRATVWYSFTPAADTMVHAHTRGSDYSTDLSAYTGESPALSQVTCNEGVFGTGEVVFFAQKNIRYYLEVEASGGGGQLNFTMLPLPGPLAGGVLVTGGGSWDRTVGNFNGGQLINSVTINASRSRRGVVQGEMAWTSVYNVLPGNGGRGISGYPWVITVNRLFWLEGNWAYVEGIVNNAGQTPFDVGRHVGFFVRDNGNGVTSPKDELGGFLIKGGNFMIQSTNR